MTTYAVRCLCRGQKHREDDGAAARVQRHEGERPFCCRTCSYMPFASATSNPVSLQGVTLVKLSNSSATVEDAKAHLLGALCEALDLTPGKMGTGTNSSVLLIVSRSIILSGTDHNLVAAARRQKPWRRSSTCTSSRHPALRRRTAAGAQFSCSMASSSWESPRRQRRRQMLSGECSSRRRRCASVPLLNFGACLVIALSSCWKLCLDYIAKLS